MSFEYSNLPVRPSGPVLRVLSHVLPGVRRTHGEVVPYARAWERANAAAARAQGPLWVVLGDSMAQGIGASSYRRGWPGQLAERLAGGHRMVNLSAYGARTVDVLERQWPAALALGPIALVTCVIGSNDVVWGRHRAALPAAFARLVDTLPAGSLVSNLPNPVRAAREVDELLRTRGAARGLRVADMRAARISWRGKLAPDHFHPNDAGYAAMADVLAAALA